MITFVIPFYFGSGSGSGSGTGAETGSVIHYVSGSIRQKVTVPAVPVPAPVPQHCIQSLLIKYGSYLTLRGRS